jgi:hypothetical protein
MGSPVSAVQGSDRPEPVEAPRLIVVVRGGRTGRTEALDVPADLDGIERLAAWLSEHEGWAVRGAEVQP